MAKGEGLFWVMPVDRVVEGIVRAIRRRRSVAGRHTPLAAACVADPAHAGVYLP